MILSNAGWGHVSAICISLFIASLPWSRCGSCFPKLTQSFLWEVCPYRFSLFPWSWATHPPTSAFSPCNVLVSLLGDSLDPLSGYLWEAQLTPIHLPVSPPPFWLCTPLRSIFSPFSFVLRWSYPNFRHHSQSSQASLWTFQSHVWELPCSCCSVTKSLSNDQTASEVTALRLSLSLFSELCLHLVLSLALTKSKGCSEPLYLSSKLHCSDLGDSVLSRRFRSLAHLT